jgi:Arc/MetJ family transcription regulator
MRTNIEIDDELMAKALRLTGLRTKNGRRSRRVCGH